MLNNNISITWTEMCSYESMYRTINFKTGPLPMLAAPAGDFVCNPPELCPRARFMPHMVEKHDTVRPKFRLETSQKSLGRRSGERGGCVMTGIFFFSARNCCTTRDVWLGTETTAPDNWRAAVFELDRTTSAKVAHITDQ
jgi:hypothetical protein